MAPSASTSNNLAIQEQARRVKNLLRYDLAVKVLMFQKLELEDQALMVMFGMHSEHSLLT